MNIAVQSPVAVIARPDPNLPIFRAEGRDGIVLRAGVTFGDPRLPTAPEEELPVAIDGALVAGTDYRIVLVDGALVARAYACALQGDELGGFHYAPGGNAEARAGGDTVPAINPFSIWDAGFRPACPDPRGMTRVTLPGGKPFWCDIYLTGTTHMADGTSRRGATIADGDSLPERPGGGTFARFDYQAAVDLLAHHGKQLLGAEEFFAAAYGTTERASLDDDPETAGAATEESVKFTSRFGLFDATGCMWVWGTDGDPDAPRASIFGGSWLDGRDAGSRYANLDYWPGNSSDDFGARGRCDHMQPA